MQRILIQDGVVLTRNERETLMWLANGHMYYFDAVIKGINHICTLNDMGDIVVEDENNDSIIFDEL